MELIYISIVDLKTMKIKDRENIIIIILAISSFILGYFIDYFLYGFHEAVKTAIFTGDDMLRGALIISVPMATANLGKQKIFGGGDIKLAFSCGAFLGFKGSVLGGLTGLATAGIYSLAALIFGKINPRDVYPLGPFLCSGYLISLLGVTEFLC